jgi:hypothetical protein
MAGNGSINNIFGIGNEYRWTAVIVGSMFIIATITAIASMMNIGSILEPSKLLENIPKNENRLIISVLLELTLAISVMGIGFMMYPLLKKENESLAVGYVVFRLAESLLIIIASVCIMVLVTLSQDYNNGIWDAGDFEPLGILLLSIRDWSFIIGTLIFLGLGGVMLNYGLFRLKLVPRWLSGWGFIGASMVIIYGVFSLFGYDPSFLAVLIGIQEMVFALWIIIRGFGTGRKILAI